MLRSFKPFSIENLIDYIETSTCDDPHFLGPLNDSNKAVDALICNGMYNEAMNILRMRLSAFSLLHSTDHSGKVTSTRNDLIYKIILCKYFSSDFEACINAINSSLSSEYAATTAGAKLNVIAMCVNYRLNNIKKSLDYFEAARISYTFTLGACLDMKEDKSKKSALVCDG